MRQLHVRLTDEVGKLLQEFAEERGISLTAAAAILIHDGLWSYEQRAAQEISR